MHSTHEAGSGGRHRRAHHFGNRLGVGDGVPGQFQAAWNTRLAQPTQTDRGPRGPQLLTAQGRGTYEARHTDGANLSWCDGHVKWQQLSELLKTNANGIYPVFTIEEDWQ